MKYGRLRTQTDFRLPPFFRRIGCLNIWRNSYVSVLGVRYSLDSSFHQSLVVEDANTKASFSHFGDVCMCQHSFVSSCFTFSVYIRLLPSEGGCIQANSLTVFRLIHLIGRSQITALIPRQRLLLLFRFGFCLLFRVVDTVVLSEKVELVRWFTSFGANRIYAVVMAK